MCTTAQRVLHIDLRTLRTKSQAQFSLVVHLSEQVRPSSKRRGARYRSSMYSGLLVGIGQWFGRLVAVGDTWLDTQSD